MKRIISAFLLVCMLSTPACTAAAWQEFRKNPILGIQNKIGILRTAISLAESAFEIWAALNPSTAAQTRVQFLHVISKVDQGIKVAEDGLQIAGAIQKEPTDLNTLLNGAQVAMTDVNAFLTGLTSGTPPSAIDPTFLLALQATHDAAHMH